MKTKPHSRNSGFSLIELLVATLLLLILIGPLFSFLRVGQANRSVTLKTTDIEQNGRAAMLAIGRDITNAGFNFSPRFPLGTVTSLNNLVGANNELTPIIPGNNVNQVKVDGSTSLVNLTDQITLAYVDQTFNNGLPLSGTYNLMGTASSTFTVNSGNVTNLFVGDLLFLNRGTQFAIATVSNISAPVGMPAVITFNSTNDVNQLNRFTAADPLNTISTLAIAGLPVAPPLLAYKFSFITYFVDGDGNLIRREKLLPPHTAVGDGGTAVAIPGMVSASSGIFTCNGTCYYDNIIATGIEDLQFTYNLTGAQPTLVPVQDPGFRGTGSPSLNLGAAPIFRLNDLREVNVSLKVRAADRDLKLRDPNAPNKGYLYRFSLNGTFGVRNLYRTNFTPDLAAVGP